MRLDVLADEGPATRWASRERARDRAARGVPIVRRPARDRGRVESRGLREQPGLPGAAAAAAAAADPMVLPCGRGRRRPLRSPARTADRRRPGVPPHLRHLPRRSRDADARRQGAVRWLGRALGVQPARRNRQEQDGRAATRDRRLVDPAGLRRTAKRICRHGYKSTEQLQEATVEQLCDVEDIGPAVAQALRAFLDQPSGGGHQTRVAAHPALSETRVRRRSPSARAPDPRRRPPGAVRDARQATVAPFERSGRRAA